MLTPVTGLAGEDASAQIRVELQSNATSVEASYPNLSPVSLNNRMRGQAFSNGRELFEIFWAPPAGGLPAGVTLTLEYQRLYSDETYGQKIRFDIPIVAERKTPFQLNDLARDAGPVSGWRVRLIHNGRVLAENTSESWR